MQNLDILDNSECTSILKVIVDNIPSSIVLIDSDMKMFYYNSAFSKLFDIDDEKDNVDIFGLLTGCEFSVIDKNACGHNLKCNFCTIRNHIYRTLNESLEYKNIPMIRNFTKGTGELDTKFLQFSTKKIIYKNTKIALLIIDDITELKNKSETLKKTVFELEKKEHKLFQEVQIAKTLQQDFLPENNIEINGLKMDYLFRPASQLSGDFIDFFPIDKNKTGIIVADIMGHGVGAGIITTALKSTITQHSTTIKRPSKLLKILNNMIRSISSSVMICALIYCIFDKKSGILTYSVAGNEYPILLKKDSDEIIYLEEKDTVLGLFDDYRFENHTITLERGDRLFLYTDGLINERNVESETFGLKRMEDIIKENLDTSFTELYHLITNKAAEHSGKTDFDDDVTLVGLTVN